MMRRSPWPAVVLLLTITALLLVPRRTALLQAPRPRPRPWTPRPRYSPAEVLHMERQVQREISLMEHGYVD